MAQKKLFRFAQIKTFPNVVEYPPAMQGEWNAFFGNPNPVVLELACGRGEYTVGLAKLHPDKNFIGVDVKGNRMYVGAKSSIGLGLKNAAFLRTQIEMLPDYFATAEVSGIWITFPDPQLRKSKAKKRLTHPRFLRLYHKILQPGGFIHLKTDSPVLYEFTREVIRLYGCTLHDFSENVYGEKNISEELSITTHYERMDIAKSNCIHYIRFSLPDNIPDKDESLKQFIHAKENG
ncbi:MAG: tRNA (guanosine(46)-N7)-methyltransferase TrmB [Chitinophagaceae bacterium]|nr:MAG: tRNA (guanosine(46)-N7)-methyltransferase TrmB [Chitinophagaceae bacterium]